MNTAVLSNRKCGHAPTYDLHEEVGSGVHRVTRLHPGDCIAGKYLIQRTLGSGGFAVVYEAEHVGLACLMAIKVLHVQAETSAALVARFHEEARISAIVHHPNLLDVHDTGELPDGSPYLVMECLNGETLQARMRRGPLTQLEVIEVARQVLTGLCMLNERGIVHRDIKPENLMLHTADNGQQLVKIVDFGISKITHADLALRSTLGGALMGTPHYMSPEHLRGEEADAQSDLYSTGVVLYEALTGRLPHDEATLNALMFSALNYDPTPIRTMRPDCPPELERIVMTALARERSLRYPSAQAMLEDLECMARACASTSPSLPPGARKRWTSSGPVLLRALGCLLLLAFKPEQAATIESHTSLHPLEPALGVVTSFGVPSDQTVGTWLGLNDEQPSITQLAPPPEERARSVAARPKRPVAPKPAQAVTSPASSLTSPGHQASMAAGAQADTAANADVDALLRDALGAYVLGRHDEAQMLYVRAIMLQPAAAEAFRGLALIAAHGGDAAAAQRALKRYLTLRPQAPDADALRARLKTLH